MQSTLVGVGSNLTPDMFFSFIEINELYKQRKELRESFAQEQMQYTETLHKARQAFYEQRKADRRKDIERNIAWEARKKER